MLALTMPAGARGMRHRSPALVSVHPWYHYVLLLLLLRFAPHPLHKFCINERHIEQQSTAFTCMSHWKLDNNNACQ